MKINAGKSYLETRFCSVVFGGLVLVLGLGCHRQAAQTAALKYQTPIAEVIRFFVSTNEFIVFEGTLQKNTGTVKGSVVSTNDQGWRIRFISDFPGSPEGQTRATQYLNLPYGGKQKTRISPLGEVTVWFPSPEEVLRYQPRLPGN